MRTLLSLLVWSSSVGAAPLDLSRALERARAHNEQVRRAGLAVRSAQAAVDSAWAAVYPTVRLSATWRLNDREVVVGDRTVQALTSLSAQAAVRMDLFEGRAIAALDPAELRRDAARAEARWQISEVSFAVADAWYAAVAGSSLRQAAERGLNSARGNLEVVQARRAVGKALAVDEARARLRVVTAEEDVTRAANVEASTRDLLGVLVVADGPVEVTIPEVPPVVAAEADVEADRPDLDALRLLGQAAEQVVADAWMDFLPALSLLGTWTVNSDGGFGGQQTAGALFLTAEWFLYDAARPARHDAEEAIARDASLEAGYRARLARFEVRQARRDLDTVGATMLTAKQRLALSNEALSQTQARYRAGRATALELVEAEDSLRQAELDVIARTLARYRARLALLRALGLDPQGKELP